MTSFAFVKMAKRSLKDTLQATRRAIGAAQLVEQGALFVGGQGLEKAELVGGGGLALGLGCHSG